LERKHIIFSVRRDSIIFGQAVIITFTCEGPLWEQKLLPEFLSKSSCASHQHLNCPINSDGVDRELKCFQRENYYFPIKIESYGPSEFWLTENKLLLSERFTFQASDKINTTSSIQFWLIVDMLFDFIGKELVVKFIIQIHFA
jgi:hypothetical protein